MSDNYKEKMKSVKQKEVTHTYYLKRKEMIELALKEDFEKPPLIMNNDILV